MSKITDTITEDSKNNLELRQKEIDEFKALLKEYVTDYGYMANNENLHLLKEEIEMVENLEKRIKNLEEIVESERENHTYAKQEVLRSDRRLNEMVQLNEEEKLHQLRQIEYIESLQRKLKIYQKQAEEAEELAALNTSKLRKLEAEIRETKERAKEREDQLEKLRAKK